MTTSTVLAGVAAVLAAGAPATAGAQPGNPQRGETAFRACTACHSLEPGVHLTGPSLAGVVGRKAATAPGFHRYSEALSRSGLAWDEPTLDAWLKDPAALVPGTSMVFRGIADARARADLVAVLKTAPPGGSGRTARPLADLKQAEAAHRITAIRYCGDAYRVSTADGKLHTFWEFNLRFKTDGGQQGPAAGKPVMLRGGMMGDRAFVVFAHPSEFPAFVRASCE